MESFAIEALDEEDGALLCSKSHLTCKKYLNQERHLMILHSVKNRSQDVHVFLLDWFPSCISPWTSKETSDQKHPDVANSSSLPKMK